MESTELAAEVNLQCEKSLESFFFTAVGQFQLPKYRYEQRNDSSFARLPSTYSSFLLFTLSHKTLFFTERIYIKIREETEFVLS